MTVHFTEVVLRCACGRAWTHHCDAWHGVDGTATTHSTDDPEPFVVQAILGLPARLKAHRVAHNLSQREVAKRTGMSFSTICRIENGEDYVVSNLIAVSAYLADSRP